MPQLSFLNLVPRRDIDTPKDALQTMVDLAKHTEALGYTRYWIAEHHNMPYLLSSATQVLVGHTLAQTTRIRVGSGGVMLPNHTPLLVAEQYGTLATLYPDRVDLGLGRAPGTDRLTAQALRRDMGAADNFADEIEQLQQYFADSKDAIEAVPARGIHVPLYVLGSSTASAYVAAALGLPYVFAAHFAPRFLPQALAIYREKFRPSLVCPKPYVMVALNATLADTDEEALYLANSRRNFAVNILRNTPKPLAPPDEKFMIRPEEAQALEAMLSCSLIGSVASATAQFAKLQHVVQADEIIATGYVYDTKAQMTSLTLLQQVIH